MKAVRIALFVKLSIAVLEYVPVHVEFLYAFYIELPDSLCAYLLHGHGFCPPAAELACDIGIHCIRGPCPEYISVLATFCAWMSSEKLIGSFRGSLVKKVYGKFKSVFHFILPVF